MKLVDTGEKVWALVRKKKKRRNGGGYVEKASFGESKGILDSRRLCDEGKKFSQKK